MRSIKLASFLAQHHYSNIAQTLLVNIVKGTMSLIL